MTQYTHAAEKNHARPFRQGRLPPRGRRRPQNLRRFLIPPLVPFVLPPFRWSKPYQPREATDGPFCCR